MNVRAFSAIGLPSVTCVRTVSPNSLRCDEEVARLSEAATLSPRPRTSSVPDSPSRCDVSVPLGRSQHRTLPPAFSAWPHALSHTSSRAQSRAPSQMSGLDVTGLLNRLVDRQHDDFQQAVQREQSARAEASQQEERAYKREQSARAEAYQREQAVRAEAKAEADSANKRLKQKPKQWQRLKVTVSPARTFDRPFSRRASFDRSFSGTLTAAVHS